MGLSLTRGRPICEQVRSEWGRLLVEERSFYLNNFLPYPFRWTLACIALAHHWSGVFAIDRYWWGNGVLGFIPILILESAFVFYFPYLSYFLFP